MNKIWCASPRFLGCVGNGSNDGKRQRRKNTDNVTTQSMGYDRKSFSPLKQINKVNIKRLSAHRFACVE